MKLRSKISRWYSLLFLVVFLVFFFLTSSAVKTAQEQSIDAFSNQTFTFKSEEIGSWLRTRLSEMQLIAAYANYHNGDLSQVLPYLAQLNEHFSERYGNVSGTFAIGHKDGIDWLGPDDSIDISQRDYFHAGLSSDQEYLLSDPVHARTDASAIVLIHYRLKDSSGTPYGFLNAALSLNKLNELVQQIDFYDGTSWIMRSDGMLYTDCPADFTQLDLLAQEIRQHPTENRVQMQQGQIHDFLHLHSQYTGLVPVYCRGNCGAVPARDAAALADASSVFGSAASGASVCQVSGRQYHSTYRNADCLHAKGEAGRSESADSGHLPGRIRDAGAVLPEHD